MIDLTTVITIIVLFIVINTNHMAQFLIVDEHSLVNQEFDNQCSPKSPLNLNY